MSRKGKIFLVGFGPGSAEHMTYRAREAIAECDVVIGYSTYIKLVKDLLDGKEVIRKGMTEEIDRSMEAYEQAKQGKTVALISSGDIGIYGMAGPTYEVLLQSGWSPGGDVEVEIVPGTTALSACASLVGAPLTHDFCSISLSDLLTPWPTIAKRINAAGRSDFVVALYNPKSGRRTRQIVEAQRILLQYRKPDTPVAIVKSAYRDLQDIHITTLKQMSEHKIGMLSTVLVGNSATVMQQGLMITPRGYADKYDQLTGEAREGEQAGRSLTMGLLNWKAVVRKYLHAQPQQPLHDVAMHFDVPVAEIIAAIAETDAETPTGGYEAVAVSDKDIMAALAASESFGPLRALVRCEAGAVSEMRLQRAGFAQEGDWLSIENEHFRLEVKRAELSQAWFVRHPDKLLELHFLNPRGESVFTLSLLKQGEEFCSESVEHYEQAWAALGLHPQRQSAVNE